MVISFHAFKTWVTQAFKVLKSNVVFYKENHTWSKQKKHEKTHEYWIEQ